ncbi:MAG: Rieske 2Fe-2S domain-containing protein [Myxococcota bacterium]|nr:Rieske 2Fe-2S domain-containing protein [Myxococcota bacterium]
MATFDEKTGRRRALQTLTLVGGVVGCGVLAVPTARFLVGPATGIAGAGRWIRTVRLESLAEGVPKRVALIADHHDAWTLEKAMELGSAWLTRSGSSVQALSVACPHLGCAVDQSASQPGFHCPCHDSSFGTDGRRMTGPSPRHLDKLETRIEDGFVFVEFIRFRLGTPEKAPVG